MVQFYADHLDAGDTVLAWSYADRYDLAYYWDRLGVKARRVTLPEGADLDAVLPLLRLPEAAPGGDVALNVWYTQRADYRGMMGCVLGGGTTSPPTSVTVYGMTTLIYHLPTLDLPELQPAALIFSDSAGNLVAQVTAYGLARAATPDRALCLPIQITLPRPLGVDLKAALSVRNELGWTIASADAIFATANQRPTSAVVPGETLAAYPLLRLPYGTPPGNYAVYLRLYDETAAPSGYEPPRGGVVVAGRDVRLSNWTALPGADWAQIEPSTRLPNRRDLAVAPDLTLLADDVADLPLTNGDELRLALLWQGSASLPDLELADEGGAWRVTASAAMGVRDAITLDWRALRVPPEAASGAAILRMVGGAELGRYRVEALPLLTDAPGFDQGVDAVFPGVGELVGFSLAAPPFRLGEPLRLTLIWRAGERAAPVSYTVFAQLISEDGRVIAQSDAIPGDRPTTGWRAGEYILDEHSLRSNNGAQPGRARLIVGLYDAASGARVHLGDGTDAVTLATDLDIQ